MNYIFELVKMDFLNNLVQYYGKHHNILSRNVNNLIKDEINKFIDFNTDELNTREKTLNSERKIIVI